MTSYSPFRNSQHELDYHELVEEIQAFAEWVHEHRARRWRVYLFTVTFNQLAGSDERRIAAMHRDIEKIQRRLITRLYRNPRQDPRLLPLWIVVPDFPVYKRFKKLPLVDVRVNDGLHMHAVLAVPMSVMRSGQRRFGLRDGRKLETHFETNRPALFDSASSVRKLHAIRVPQDDIKKVVDYAFKSVKNRRVSRDAVAIYPEVVVPSSYSRGQLSGTSVWSTLAR